jgi:3-methylcrotonyl-CoA carboxylase alpha subunit
MGEAAVKAAQAIGYVGAGTVEFLLDERGDFFFMEMNTRLQVEHPVTEAITGLDLVAWQIRVARGEPLPISQQQVPLNGHAIEVRLYAEDPEHDFLPATGTLALYREGAAGAGRRFDSGVAEGDSVSPFYDPMLGKLIAWGEDREQARLRLLTMLDETLVGGVRTNLAFLRRILSHPAFAACELDTGFIPRHQQQLLPSPGELPERFWQLAADAWVQTEAALQRADDSHSPWATRSGWRSAGAAEVDLHLSCQGTNRKVRAGNQAHFGDDTLQADIEGTRQRLRCMRRGDTLYLQWHGELHAITRFDPIAAAEASHAQHGGLGAPMNGSIVRVLVEAGQAVEAGTALVVLEAMKMEHSIRAPEAGTVKALYCCEGEMVSEGTVLVELES